jgi:hypothetical protein
MFARFRTITAICDRFNPGHPLLCGLEGDPGGVNPPLIIVRPAEKGPLEKGGGNGVGTGDARASDGGAEWRHRPGLWREARSVARTRAGALVPGLVEVLGFLDGGRGPMDVRVASRGGWPVVRTDLWAEDADCLAWLFTRYWGEDGPGADALSVTIPLDVLPGDYRGPQAAGDFDSAGANPGWDAWDSGVKYLGGYQRASAAAEALKAAIGPALPDGLVVVGWDTWQDGRGVVRLDLEAGNAARFTVIVDYLVEQAGPELFGRG